MDDRGRVAVPAKFVPVMRQIEGIGENDPLEVVISLSKFGGLGIYPKSVFDEMLTVLEDAPPDDVDAEKLLTTYLRYMEEQVLDKQNRVRIPMDYAMKFGLIGEVQLVGNGNYLEVMTREQWNKQFEARNEELPELDRRVRVASYNRRYGAEAEVADAVSEQ